MWMCGLMGRKLHRCEIKRRNGKEPGWPEWLVREGPDLWFHLFDGTYHDGEGGPVLNPQVEDYFEEVVSWDVKNASWLDWLGESPSDRRREWGEWEVRWDREHPRWRCRRTGRFYFEGRAADGRAEVVEVPTTVPTTNPQALEGHSRH